LKTSVSLKILEAYTRDVGRGVARIDHDTMDTLSASTGDVIEIKGNRTTVAKCLPLYPSEEGKGIIRIDGLGRNNAEIVIGDTITIRKIKAVAAKKVVVAPLEAIPLIHEQYLRDSLEGVPVIKGDNVMVPYFGGRLTFQIIDVTPAADAVKISQKTVFRIKGGKKTKRETRPKTIKDIDDAEDEQARFERIMISYISPKRIDILRILKSKGPLTYSELKSLSGFKSKKKSGTFAYYLRRQLRQKLVALNKSERRYRITNLGELVLNLAEEIAWGK